MRATHEAGWYGRTKAAMTHYLAPMPGVMRHKVRALCGASAWTWEPNDSARYRCAECEALVAWIPKDPA